MYLYVYPVITCASGPPSREHRVEPRRGDLIELFVNPCWNWFWRACVVYIPDRGGIPGQLPKYRVLILLHHEIPSTVGELILTHEVGPRGPCMKRLLLILCNTPPMSLSFIRGSSRTACAKLWEQRCNNWFPTSLGFTRRHFPAAV